MENSNKKIMKGTVTSNKMIKTLVVRIDRLKKHPKYKKFFKTSKKFKAHYTEGEYNIGDNVLIREAKPISKDKKWIVVGKVENFKEKQN